MSAKLSERLEQHSIHCALCSDPGSDAVYTPGQIGELAGLIREAAASARAIEDAPEVVFGPIWGAAWLLANERFVGKRVKLVEVK